MRSLLTGIAASLVLAATTPAPAASKNLAAAVPHYDHILVIVEENKGYSAGRRAFHARLFLHASP